MVANMQSKSLFFTGWILALYTLIMLTGAAGGRVPSSDDLTGCFRIMETVDPGRFSELKVHPLTVFEDSVEFLQSFTSDIGKLRVVFSDNGEVDLHRWLHLMATQSFHPSFGLFSKTESTPEKNNEDVENQAQTATRPIYDIFSGKVPRPKAQQQKYLEVAGKFVAHLVRMGRVLDRSLSSEIYQEILNPGASDEHKGQRELWRAAFARGFLAVIPPHIIQGATLGTLDLLIAGIPFDSLPEGWRPPLKIVPDLVQLRTTPNLATASVYQELDLQRVGQLWRMATNMTNVPVTELQAPEGFAIREMASNIFPGLSADPSSRTLEVCPISFGDPSSVFWINTASFSSRLADIKYISEHIPDHVQRPIIEIALDPDGKVLGRLQSIIIEKGVNAFAKAKMAVIDGTENHLGDEVRFFALLRRELTSPESKLFQMAEGDPEKYNLVLEELADEELAARLEWCRLAGWAYGKIIREVYFAASFSLVDGLERLLRGEPQNGDASNLESSPDHHPFYAAFAAGVHEIIPPWVYMSIRSFFSLAIGPGDFVELYTRLIVPDSTVDDAAYRAIEARRLLVEALKMDLRDGRIMLFNILISGRPSLLLPYLLRGPIPRWNLVLDREQKQISVTPGTITVPLDCNNLVVEDWMNQVLNPVRLVQLLLGVSPSQIEEEEEEQEELSIEANAVLQTLYELWLQEGTEKCKFAPATVHPGHCQTTNHHRYGANHRPLLF